MNKHVIRGHSKGDVLERALSWISNRRHEWCEEWEMDDSIIEGHSNSISLKPYSLILWRIDDE